jgi:hypothetical protein
MEGGRDFSRRARRKKAGRGERRALVSAAGAKGCAFRGMESVRDRILGRDFRGCTCVKETVEHSGYGTLERRSRAWGAEKQARRR